MLTSFTLKKKDFPVCFLTASRASLTVTFFRLSDTFCAWMKVHQQNNNNVNSLNFLFIIRIK